MVFLVGSLLNTMARTTWWLILSQIVVGVGSGTLGVTRCARTSNSPDS